MPTRTTHLSESELQRLTYVGQQLGLGVPTLIRLAVKHLLGDPLPEWAQRVVDELRADNPVR